MEIILLILKNSEITENIDKIKLINHKIAVLTDKKHYKHYIEEYMPEYIILSANISNFDEIVNYISNNLKCELIVTDVKKEINHNLYGNINITRIKNLNELQKVLTVIDKLKTEEKESTEENIKYLRQQIISFYSIQGGTGKTTIAFNLAWHLKDQVDEKILLLDLNFCEGPSDLNLNLKLEKSPNLSMFIEKISEGVNYFNESVITLSDYNIDILQPPLSIYQSDKLNVDMLGSIIYSARNKYNIIIADIPFRYDNISLEMLNLSTISILVLSADINLVSRVDSFQKFLPSDQKKGVIFNKVISGEIQNMEKYINFLNFHICDHISDIPENFKKYVKGKNGYFNILDLQSKMNNLKEYIFSNE